MAGPGDAKAAASAGRGHLRASHADREQTIDMLKAAFVEGRLTRDELDERIGQALASGTYPELAAVTADIPAGLAGAQPRQPPRRPVNNAVRWGASGLMTPAILAAALGFASLHGAGGYEVGAFVVAFVYFVLWLSVGSDMLWEWYCTSLPSARVCVRCAHTVASHRAPSSCGVRLGSPALWRRCPCAGYVPPGLSPHAADLRGLAATG